MIMPGDNGAMQVELITPIAMEEKQRFAIREAAKTVGAGVVVRSRVICLLLRSTSAAAMGGPRSFFASFRWGKIGGGLHLGRQIATPDNRNGGCWPACSIRAIPSQPLQKSKSSPKSRKNYAAA